MQPYACFWDDSTYAREARIWATRRMDYSRSFLVSQGLTPDWHGRSCRTLCILQYTKGCPSLLYPDRERERCLGSGPVFPLVKGSGPNEGMHGRYCSCRLTKLVEAK